MARTTTTDLLLANGKRAQVPFKLALEFVGLDADGEAVYRGGMRPVAVRVWPLTDAQRLAYRQGWSKLPTGKVGELRDALAAVATPTAADYPGDDKALRNARVGTWRTRKQLEAAIDAQGAPTARVRAIGKVKAAGAEDPEGAAVELASGMPMSVQTTADNA